MVSAGEALAGADGGVTGQDGRRPQCTSCTIQGWAGGYEQTMYRAIASNGKRKGTVRGYLLPTLRIGPLWTTPRVQQVLFPARVRQHGVGRRQGGEAYQVNDAGIPGRELREGTQVVREHHAEQVVQAGVGDAVAAVAVPGNAAIHIEAG